jgi:DNA-directed RNA polymerase subunit D
MEKVDKTDKVIVFKENIEESLANAIRRYINQVEVLAVDEVEIKKNDSALYDETLAHRVGLVPLKNKKVDAKGVKLKISVKKEGAVYSEEMGGEAEVVEGKIPLVLLDKGQEMDLVATAKLGKGVEHAKYSPGLMFYRDVSEITLDKALAGEIKNSCPDAEVKEKGDKVVVLDNKKTEVCDVCEGIAKRAGKSVETKATGELVVTLESWGQMPVGDIFTESVNVLKKDLSELSKKLK